MQPLSNDLRRRILDAVDNREGSRRKLAARFSVNTSTITRLLQLRRQTGSFEPGLTAAGSSRPSTTTPFSGSGSSSRRPPTPRSKCSSKRWASPAAG